MTPELLALLPALVLGGILVAVLRDEPVTPVRYRPRRAARVPRIIGRRRKA